MLTATQAKAMGASDRITMTAEECDDIAESIKENYGGKTGSVLAAAYRKGAGIL